MPLSFFPRALINHFIFMRHNPQLYHYLPRRPGILSCLCCNNAGFISRLSRQAKGGTDAPLQIVDIRAEGTKPRESLEIRRTWPTVNCGRMSHVCLGKGWAGGSTRTERRWTMCYRMDRVSVASTNYPQNSGSCASTQSVSNREKFLVFLR